MKSTIRSIFGASLLVITLCIFNRVNVDVVFALSSSAVDPAEIVQTGQFGNGTVQTLDWNEGNIGIQTTSGVFVYNLANGNLQSIELNNSNHRLLGTHLEGGRSLIITEVSEGVIEVSDNDSTQQFRALNGTVSEIAFAPDSNLLAVAQLALFPFEAGSEADFDIQVLNLTTGQLQYSFQETSIRTIDLVFSDDGQLLAAATADGNIYLWSMLSGQIVNVVQGNDPVEFISSSHTLVYTQENKIVLFDSDMQTEQSILFPERVQSIATTSQQLAIGDETGLITVFDLPTLATAYQLTGNYTSVGDMDWSESNALLAVSIYDGLTIWNTQTRAISSQLTGFTLAVRDADWTSDTSILAVESEGGRSNVRSWDVGSEEYTWQLAIDNTAYNLAAHLDAAWIHTFDQVTAINLQNRGMSTTFETPEIRSIAYNPQSSHLAIASYNIATIINANTNSPLYTIQGHNDLINAITFSPNGQMLATGSGRDGMVSSQPDNSLRLWDANTGQQIALFTNVASPVFTIAFSPDNHWIASGHADGTVQIWDIERQILYTVLQTQAAVHALTFAPNNSYVVIGADNGDITFLSMQTAQVVRSISAHRARISALSFSRNGQYFLSSSHDGTIKLWGVNS